MTDEDVKPVLVAQFVTDDNGMPKFHPDMTDSTYAHYKIRLMVKGAPSDAYAVTYGLDETYYEPIRESRNKDENFSAEITSYGDYPVRAIVRSRQGVQNLVTDLSKALALGNTKGKPQEIASAIEYIKSH